MVFFSYVMYTTATVCLFAPFMPGAFDIVAAAVISDAFPCAYRCANVCRKENTIHININTPRPTCTGEGVADDGIMGRGEVRVQQTPYSLV